ncbi:MAG: HD domain-containing phosphohydrolase, partial [Anaerolineales bacterium]
TGFIHLRTALVMPLRLRNDNRGAILAFGKQGELTFTDSDEALGHLLSNQATAALDSAELHEEISDMLNTATTLNLLSTRVIQSEKVTDAAAAIAESARRLGNASAAGIVLYTEAGQIQAQVQIDASGISPGNRHPFQTIQQSMESSERIIQAWEGQTSICLPLQTPHRQYGTLWLEIPNDIWQHNHYVDNLQTLANQAAIALERSLLLVETTEKSEKIAAAYAELQETYRQTLVALTSALDARDRETEGHSIRVTQMSLLLAKIMGLPEKQLEVLERGALLHDIGKIGISDTILHKPGKLSEAEWVEMRKHPDIGARIVSGIPFLQDAIPVILYHQERWDGSGYPIGLKGTEIPLLARIFAVVDTFDALTSIRPYRTRISPQEAAQYIKEQAYIHFDPDVVRALLKALEDGSILGLMAD